MSGGASDPEIEPSCLGTASVNDETGAEIGDVTEDASVVPKIVVEAPTTGDTLYGKMLESEELLNNNP